MLEKMGGWMKKKTPENAILAAQIQSGALDAEDAQQEDSLLKLRVLSPKAYRLYNELHDPTLSRDDFFAKITAYNDSHSRIPAEGPYTQIDDNATIPDNRVFKIKMFANGRVMLSGSDKNFHDAQDNPLHESGEHITLPQVGELVILSKVALKNNNASAVSAGDNISGVLVNPIEIGKSILLDDGAQTSVVKAIKNEGGKILIETNTSLYEVM